MRVQNLELLNMKDVCEMLGCSRRTVYRLKDAGKMPMPMKINGMVRWRPKEIEDWIANGCPDLRVRNFRPN